MAFNMNHLHKNYHVNTNELITSLMIALGYTINETGACSGLVMMGIRAFFNGSLKNYDNCIISIVEHVIFKGSDSFVNACKELSTTAQVTADNKAQHNLDSFGEEIIENLAILDGTAILQSPNHYTSWFNEFISQNEDEKIIPFTSADKIKLNGGICKSEPWLLDLTINELTEYLTKINESVITNKQDVAITLARLFHRIGFLYDAQSMTWILIDPIRLPTKSFPQSKFNEFIDAIHIAFVNFDNKAALDVALYTLGKSSLRLNFCDHKITTENVVLHADTNKEIIFFAARKGYTNLIAQLAINGERFNWLMPPKRISPLYSASFAGHYKIVEMMARAGANLNVQTIDGNSPALIAALFGHDKVIDTLGKYKANLNLKNDDGWTPALIAARNRNKYVLELLGNHGVLLDQPAPCGLSPLDIARDTNQKTLEDFIINYIKSRNETSKSPYTTSSPGRTSSALFSTTKAQMVTGGTVPEIGVKGEGASKAMAAQLPSLTCRNNTAPVKDSGCRLF